MRGIAIDGMVRVANRGSKLPRYKRLKPDEIRRVAINNRWQVVLLTIQYIQLSCNKANR